MELFRLLGTIAINNALANEALDETADKGDKTEGKLSSAFSKIKAAAIAGGAAISAAVVKFGKDAVASYADYEQLVGGVETLFDTSANKVLKYAQNAYTTAGLSANEYMETVTSFSASLLQSLDNDTAKAAESANLAITDMSDNANKMGTSMESIQNAYQGFAKQNYTMLDNLKLGYGGTKEEMERLLDDASKLSGIKYDLSSFDDIVQAIHVVQTEMGITGTTSEEAASTIQGSASAMKSSWQNLLTGFADGNQDLDSLLKQFTDSVKTYGKNLLPRVKQTAESIFGLIKEKIPQLATTGIEMLNELSGGIKQKLPEFISTALDILTSFSEKILKNAPTLVATGINLLRNIVKGIMDALPEMIEKVPTILSNFANVINQNAPTILMAGVGIVLDIVKGIIKAIPTLVANIPKIIKAIIDVWSAVNWLNLGKNLIGQIGKGIKNMGYSLKGTASKLFEGLKNQIGTIFTRIKTIITNPIFSAKTKILALIGEMKYGVTVVFKSLQSSVATIFKSVKNAIVHPIQTAKKTIKGIVDAIKSIFSKLNLKFPNIPLPHFSVKPSGWKIGDLLKGEIPKLGIDWYAKGGIMTKPTVFGINGNNAMVGGEAGAEAIAPIDTLQQYVATAVAEQNGVLVEALNKILAAILSLDGNMYDNLKNALAGTTFEMNHREFARLVRAVE